MDYLLIGRFLLKKLEKKKKTCKVVVCQFAVVAVVPVAVLLPPPPPSSFSAPFITDKFRLFFWGPVSNQALPSNSRTKHTVAVGAQRPGLHHLTVSSMCLMRIVHAFLSDTTHCPMVTSKSVCRTTVLESGSGFVPKLVPLSQRTRLTSLITSF